MLDGSDAELDVRATADRNVPSLAPHLPVSSASYATLFFASTDDITASMPLVRSQVLDGSVKSSFASLAALDGNYSSDQHRAMIFDLAMSGGTQGAHAFGAAGAGLGPGGGSSRKNGFRGPVEDGGRGTASPAQRRTRRRNKQRNHADSLSR